MNIIDILSAPWAIEPTKLREIQEIYATHLRGEKIDVDALEVRLGRPLANDQQEYQLREGGVAVLGVDGVIAPKANLFTRISGGVSAQMLTKQVESAIIDPRVRALVLAIDSPGGSVHGTPELAAAIRQLAAEKSIVAVGEAMMASGAYWLGAAANRVFISGPTVMVGSIGVVATHNFNPRAGAGQVTEITAGRYKRIASDNAPLSDEGRAYLQQQIDHIYAVFVESVAANRGVSVEEVLEHMADGRVFVGQQAIDAGLVDGVSTVDAVVEELAADPKRYSGRKRAVIKAVHTSAPPPPAPAASSPPVAGAPAEETHTPKTTGVTMDRKTLETEHTALFAELRTAFLAEGAKAERERIQAVEAQSMRGHEALIEQLKYDGKTTGPEAAVQVLGAEKRVLSKAGTDLAKDAPPPLNQAPAKVEDGAKPKDDDDDGRPVEERCKAAFEGDKAIRAEFGTLAVYTAYVRNKEAGNVRELRNRRAA